MRIDLRPNIWIFIAAINGFLAVFAGAMGSHTFASHLDEHAVILYGQAADYQMSHALALLFTGLLLNHANEKNKDIVHLAGFGFAIGILFFSGALYWLALNGSGSLGSFHYIPPIGGVSLLFGWFMLIIANFKTIMAGRK
jgi:uncharacterized membrane protein YgdD (TMEM256/DUF423 family)